MPPVPLKYSPISTLKTGTLPKNSENLSESIVAEVTISLRSFLLATTCIRAEYIKMKMHLLTNSGYCLITCNSVCIVFMYMYIYVCICGSEILVSIYCISGIIGESNIW